METGNHLILLLGRLVLKAKSEFILGGVQQESYFPRGKPEYLPYFGHVI